MENVRCGSLVIKLALIRRTGIRVQKKIVDMYPSLQIYSKPGLFL
jgi:hypothetical protein